MTEPARPAADSSDYEAPLGAHPGAQVVGYADNAHLPSAPLGARIMARVRPGHFDRMLSVGFPAAPGSALAVHAARITSVAEREAIARTLRQAIREITDPTSLSPRMPIHRTNIAAAEATIDVVTLRLHSPRLVAARGMARLRLLLTDGMGPFYDGGRGDLEGRLGAALAAL